MSKYDPSEEKKTKAELKAEQDLMMARAAIKRAVTAFVKDKQPEPIPKELQEYWNSLDQNRWREHLALFSKELKKYRQVGIKKLLFDLDNYIKDCRKLIKGFSRTREEILLMIAIGQISVSDLVSNLDNLPSNREKLDRKIHKQIKELDWEDDNALRRLEELNKQLDKPKIKKDEIEKIEKEIKDIEIKINERKAKRDELAIKLVEWKARGNIDIASEDGKFRLDA